MRLRPVVYLQANKLACHSFIDAGIRHKTPGSETKDRLLLIAIAVEYHHFYQFSKP